MSAATDEYFRVSKIKKDIVSGIAMTEAIKWSIGATIIGGGLTALAIARSKKFDRFMSVSAKTSIPVMAGLGMFAFRYEITQHDCLQHPEKYPQLRDANYVAEKVVVTTMPIHHRAINYLYDNPFSFIAGVGVPMAGGILYQNMKLTHLTLSQKIMHSRVIAQGGVLLILLSTMAFTKYMDKYGRFPEPGDEIAPASKEEVVDYTAGNLHRHTKK
jgi:hypothetical protein